MQTAYRIESNADLVMPTRRAVSQGLPEQFSFVITFRNRRTEVSQKKIFLLKFKQTPV